MLIHNGTIVTFLSGRTGTDGKDTQVIEKGAVYIEGNEIRAVGDSAKLEQAYPDAERLDARGQLIMPGFICAHTHFYGAFAKGMYIPGDAPKDFPEILAKLWWQLDKSLDEEGVRYSALVCLADAVRHGCTTLVDHHASPNAIDGSLDVIAAAVEQAGVRAGLCYEVSDRDGPERSSASVRENIRFLRKVQEGGFPSGLIGGIFGLHASLTLDNSTLEACANAAPAGTGFHIHVAEHPIDQDDSIKRSGKRVVERLRDADILGPNTITAHCIHVDAWEQEILRDTDTWVTHQPRSNMNNAVGAADVSAMLRGGVNVGLGNDGFSNDMLMEMKSAYLLHKVWRGDPRVMGADQVVQMAVLNNARLAQLFFSKPVGAITPGALADIVLLEYDPSTPLTAENLPWHMIFGMSGSHVSTTICNGKVLMQDRKLLTLDEEEIMARSREVAQATWQRFRDLSK